jgi:hypothetical protein
MSEKRTKNTTAIHSTGDRRTGNAPHEHESVYDFFVDLIQAGLGQVALFSLPALWIIAATPVYTTEIATSAVVSIATISLLLPLFRGGHLTAGRPWPVLTNRRLGTGTGWQAFLTRIVSLSSTLLFVSYTGVLVELVTDTALLSALVAIGLSYVAIASIPYLSADSRKARLGRLAYCLAGLFPMAVVFSRVPVVDIDPTIGLVVLSIHGLLIVDTRPFASDSA